MARLYMWSLLFGALNVISTIADVVIDCDDVDAKCPSCITLRHTFVSTCLYAVIQVTCPDNCKVSYEALLAHGSQTEPNLGRQYAVCTCQPGATICGVRHSTIEKCNISYGGLSTPSTSPTSGTGTRNPMTGTEFPLSCDTFSAECLKSTSCAVLIDSVIKECFGNETDTVANSTCSPKCRVAILTGKKDTVWNQLETCSLHMCPANDSACQNVLQVRRVIDACSISISTMVSLVSTVVETTNKIPSVRNGTGTGMSVFGLFPWIILSLLVYNIISYL